VSERRPSPVDNVHRAAARVRARGPREAARVLFDRTRAGLASSDRLLFFVRAGGGDTPTATGLAVRWATGADAQRYESDVGTEPAASFAARLTRCTGCFLIVERDRILHSTWVTQAGAWTRELRRFVCPPAGDAYVYESFTRPEARGRGLYPLALRAVCAEAARTSVRRVWVGVEDRNVASLRAVTKAGFEIAATVPYRRSMGRLSLGPIEHRGPRPFLDLRGPHAPPAGC
jgi:RimJ/RimL family protein N-acetyltransferase